MYSKNKNHYVPKCILKNFCSGRTKQAHYFIFEKQNGRVKDVKTSIDNIFNQKGFYEQTTEDSFVKIEGGLASVIKAIVDDRKAPNEDEIILLQEYMFRQWIRTPYAKIEIKAGQEEFKEEIPQISKSKILLKDKYDPFFEMIKKELPSAEHYYGFDGLNNVRSNYMEDVYLKHFEGHSIRLLEASNNSFFILSDNPCIRAAITFTLGEQIIDRPFVLPVTPQLALISAEQKQFGNLPLAVKPTTTEFVKYVNLAQIEIAQVGIVSHTSTLPGYVKEALEKRLLSIQQN